MKNIHRINGLIYITSEEKTGYILAVSGIWNGTITKAVKEPIADCWRKIILTNNPALISDGIQAIEPEAVKWLNENPSCEWVDVTYYMKKIGVETDANGWREMDVLKRFYNIIIPTQENKYDLNSCKHFDQEIGCEKADCICEKQEQKQHLIDLMRDDEKLGLYDTPKQSVKDRILSQTSEETKQKVKDYANNLVNNSLTIEEAAETYVNNFSFGISHSKRVCKKAFANGAKSQAAREYWFKIFKSEQQC